MQTRGEQIRLPEYDVLFIVMSSDGIEMFI